MKYSFFFFFLFCFLKLELLAESITAFTTFQQKDTINFTDAKGNKQGKWIGKYDNGKKRYEGSFKDNNPVDTFFYFDESGQKNAQMIFSDNGRKSEASYFHLTGKMKGKGSYVDQKKDGTWLYYDDREILSEEANYKMGKREGVSKIFYLDGSIAEEKQWKNDVEHGLNTQFFPGGKMKFDANYVDGNPDGKVIFYHPNGQVKSIGIYQHAVKNGEWISYNADGTIYTIEIFNKGVVTKLEKKNGVFTSLYPNGSLKEVLSYNNGLKNGTITEYYDKIITEHKDTTAVKSMDEWEKIYSGVPMSEDELVVESPKIKKRGNYVNDKLEGEMTYYNNSGTIDKVEIYKDGQLVKKK